MSDILQEEAYEAFLAGSELEINPNIQGFEISFFGFSNVLHILID
jgi:secreted Zn-dependent insulinase-like peptidase